jgi:exopolysaccharide/PEP-CTERM locus tyrosine autokinase
MSSSIERAAERLEQLRQAGAQMPAPASLPAAPAAAPASAVGATPALSSPARAEPGSGSSTRRVELDLEALAAAGYVTPSALRSAVADQFRVIKRPLIANAMGKGAAPVANGNLIMVTSALPGEGKSFTALNLALSMAMEYDHTVMLVDADVARPSMMRVLGLPQGPGLMDLLLGHKKDVSDVLLRTNIEKLTLLPSGTQHERATELLASDTMTRLVEDIGQRYEDRIIVFDSPPLLLTTESRVLATHMGQIVMVVQAEKTLQSQVRHALSTIESCPVKLMLLNKARASGQDAYGYGYGYGYGKSSPVAEAAL